MSWNGSDHVGAASSPQQKNGAASHSSTSRFNYKALLAGLIVVAIGGIAAWWFVGRARTPAAPSSSGAARSARIADATPASGPKVAETNETHEGMVKFRGKWYPKYNSKGGKIWLSPRGVRYHTPEIHTVDLTRLNERKELTYFDTQCDKEIAALISAPLGAMRIGPARPYKAYFTKQFLDSLKTPIIVSHDDPEEIKTLKRSVIETKKELKDRYDAGEDIVEIMNDSAEKMKELSLYKNELKRTVEKESRDVKTVAEAQDLYEAANKMLAERGVQPLKLPVVLQRKLEFQSKKSARNQNTQGEK